MDVVRSGAVVAVLVTGLVGLGGTASAQEVEPSFDPSIAEQQVDQPSDTSTATTGGCDENPVICQSGGAAGEESLPRTGPYDALLATAAVGAGLLLAGAGAVVAGRRRTA